MMKDKNTVLFKTIATCLLVAVFVTSIPCLEEARALAPWAGALSLESKRHGRRIALELTNRFRVAKSDEDKLRLGEDSAMLYDSGTILVSEEVADNNLLLLRNTIYIEVKALMQVMAKDVNDSVKYNAIKGIICRKFPPEDKKNPEPHVNHIFAEAFEILILLEKGLISEEDITEEGMTFIDKMRPIIEEYAKDYFWNVFFNWDLRRMRIGIAIANGNVFDEALTKEVGKDGFRAIVRGKAPESYRGPDPYFKKVNDTKDLPMVMPSFDGLLVEEEASRPILLSNSVGRLKFVRNAVRVRNALEGGHIKTIGELIKLTRKQLLSKRWGPRGMAKGLVGIIEETLKAYYLHLGSEEFDLKDIFENFFDKLDITPRESFTKHFEIRLPEKPVKVIGNKEVVEDLILRIAHDCLIETLRTKKNYARVIIEVSVEDNEVLISITNNGEVLHQDTLGKLRDGYSKEYGSTVKTSSLLSKYHEKFIELAEPFKSVIKFTPEMKSAIRKFSYGMSIFLQQAINQIQQIEDQDVPLSLDYDWIFSELRGEKLFKAIEDTIKKDPQNSAHLIEIRRMITYLMSVPLEILHHISVQKEMGILDAKKVEFQHVKNLKQARENIQKILETIRRISEDEPITPGNSFVTQLPIADKTSEEIGRASTERRVYGNIYLFDISYIIVALIVGVLAIPFYLGAWFVKLSSPLGKGKSGSAGQGQNDKEAAGSTVQVNVHKMTRNRRYEHCSEMFPKGPFGTSGVRTIMEFLNDIQCYTIMQGLISFFTEMGESEAGSTIAFSADRRPTSPDLLRAIIVATQAMDRNAFYAREVPTPVITNYGLYNEEGRMQTVMGTASHVQFDASTKIDTILHKLLGFGRWHGFKPTLRWGEVLKKHERRILAHVRELMEIEYRLRAKASMFGEDGKFKNPADLKKVQRGLLKRADEIMKETNTQAEDMYFDRYVEAFGRGILNDIDIGYWQHTSVGRRLIPRIFKALGARVHYIGRKERWDWAVDTEDIKPKVAVVAKGLADELRKKVEKKGRRFLGLSTSDGDSDRPGMFDESGVFNYGDKLSYLTCEYIQKYNPGKEMHVVVTASTNEAVIRKFEDMKMHVHKVMIGSPYVVKEMTDVFEKIKDEHPNAIVVGFERNGGFLTGTDIKLGNGVLKALPTRDAILSLICAFHLAKEEGKTISQLFQDRFSGKYASFSWSGLIDNTLTQKDFDQLKHLSYTTEQVELATKMANEYTAPLGQAMIRNLSPRNFNIDEVRFHKGGKVTYTLMGHKEVHEADPEFTDYMQEIRGRLKSYFTDERTFGEIDRINFLDGVRIYFKKGKKIEIFHIRPSGNSPQLRDYTEAETFERTLELNEWRLIIYPEIIRDSVLEKERLAKTTRFVPKSIQDIMKLLGRDEYGEWVTYEMTFGENGQHSLRESIELLEDSLISHSDRRYDWGNGKTEEIKREMAYRPKEQTIEIKETVNGKLTVHVTVKGEKVFIDIGKVLDRNVPMYLKDTPVGIPVPVGLVEIGQPFRLMDDEVIEAIQKAGVRFLHLFDIMPTSIVAPEPLLWQDTFRFQAVDAEQTPALARGPDENEETPPEDTSGASTYTRALDPTFIGATVAGGIVCVGFVLWLIRAVIRFFRKRALKHFTETIEKAERLRGLRTELEQTLADSKIREYTTKILNFFLTDTALKFKYKNKQILKFLTVMYPKLLVRKDVRRFLRKNGLKRLPSIKKVRRQMSRSNRGGLQATSAANENPNEIGTALNELAANAGARRRRSAGARTRGHEVTRTGEPLTLLQDAVLKQALEELFDGDLNKGLMETYKIIPGNETYSKLDLDGELAGLFTTRRRPKGAYIYIIPDDVLRKELESKNPAEASNIMEILVSHAGTWERKAQNVFILESGSKELLTLKESLRRDWAHHEAAHIRDIKALESKIQKEAPIDKLLTGLKRIPIYKKINLVAVTLSILAIVIAATMPNYLVEHLTFPVYYTLLALTGHYIASRLDGDRSWGRFAVVGGLTFAFTFRYMPFYNGFLINLPNHNLWWRSVKPFIDIFIFAQPMVFANVCVMGLKQCLEKPLRKEKVLSKNWARGTSRYIKEKISLFYSKNNLFMVMVLFWFPLIYLMYAYLTHAEYLQLAGLLIPVFVIASAVFIVQKPGHELTEYPMVNKILKHIFLAPIAAVVGIVAGAYIAGYNEFGWNATLGLLNTGVGYIAYIIWTQFMSYIFKPLNNGSTSKLFPPPDPARPTNDRGTEGMRQASTTVAATTQPRNEDGTFDEKEGGSPNAALLIFAKNSEIFLDPKGFTNKDHKKHANKVSERTRQRDREFLIKSGHLSMDKPGHYALTHRGILMAISKLYNEVHKENLGTIEVVDIGTGVTKQKFDIRNTLNLMVGTEWPRMQSLYAESNEGVNVEYTTYGISARAVYDNALKIAETVPRFREYLIQWVKRIGLYDELDEKGTFHEIMLYTLYTLGVEIREERAPDSLPVIASMSLRDAEELSEKINFDNFDLAITALRRESEQSFVGRADMLEREAASYGKSGQSLILYADDILENAVVLDLEDTVKNILVKHNILQGGKIILYAREAASATILERIINRTDPSIDVITITKDELRNTNGSELKEVIALVSFAKRKGANEILALIRGPLSLNLSEETAQQELNAIAEFARQNEIPIIIVGAVKNAVYSFAQALVGAMQIKTQKGSNGTIATLLPIKVYSEEIEEEYTEYLKSLHALTHA